MDKSDVNQKTRTLTVIEYREGNFPMVKDFEVAAKRKGWDFFHLDGIDSEKLTRCDLDDIPLDFVICRGIKNSIQEIESLSFWLNRYQKVSTNMSVLGGCSVASDKHFQQGLFLMDPILKKYALPTYAAEDKVTVLKYIKSERVHFPIVLKKRRGTAGKNIILVRNETELNTVKDFKNTAVQQYIKPECDFRVFVIGGVAVGTMRKYGDPNNPGDFRAWSGGREKHTEDDPEVLDILSEIATRAATACHNELAGIDALRSAKTGEYYILENNISAGWMNIPSHVHIDIPGITIDWMSDRADAREQSFAEAIETYLKKRKRYLPQRIQKSCDDILKGIPEATKPYQELFKTYYPDKYSYDAGYIFNKLNNAYQEIATHPGSYLEFQPEKLAYIKTLIQEIEDTPFSWAGNFIGPNIGTFHDGAILSALYLFILHKTAEM